jgi:hypothetical protein
MVELDDGINDKTSGGGPLYFAETAEQIIISKN